MVADPPADTHTTQLGLSPQLLSDIEQLKLAAQQAAQGAIGGIHRSRRRGASMEFSEHKLYTAGDDTRHIDWHVFAKTDRYHVKQFEDETNLRLHLLLDHSGSMGFSSNATQHPSKLHYATTLAAALSTIALRQGDATGLFTFSEQVTEQLPARARGTHLLEILTRLVQLQPHGPTQVGQAVSRFAQGNSRRALCIMLSDLFDPDPHLQHAFARLAARGHDVAVLHILDPKELSFDYESPAQFASMEDSRRLFVHPRALRATYQREMREFLNNTQRHMGEAGIRYLRVITDTPPSQALATFLRPQ